MRFLVDAQLPRRLTNLLTNAGHDAIHTLDLPNANLTPDAEIITIAEDEGRVVITKDSDFVTSFLLTHRPPKLLLIATGNITNQALETLLSVNLAAVVAGLTTHDFVELNRTALILRA
jgi:predicted nuclease of predicted toxin-antitoxin system